MSSSLLLIALGIAIVATGLVAGVFLAFSDFVMRALALVPPAAGSEAMQVVNREVFRSIFIVLLIGMSVYSVLLGLYALFLFDGAVAWWVLSGSAVYVIGTFLVTIVFNVPMNQKLAPMDPAATETVAYWAIYLKDWTKWNTVRTVAPLLSMVCYLVAFYHLARQIWVNVPSA